MDGLIGIGVVVLLVVIGIALWPRLTGRSGASGRPPTAQPATVPSLALQRPDDPDQVDEADLLLAAMGGQLRPGDAVLVPVDDPEVWGATSFELNLSVDAVSRAAIRDQTGLFSFWVYWFRSGQEADVLMIEGDAPALSEALVARRVTDEALVATLAWCRGRYLSDREQSLIDFDLSDHDLGHWTAFSVREGGKLRVLAGQAPLLAASASAGDGLDYADFTLRPAGATSAERLRLIQVGSYTYLVRGEVIRLAALHYLRRSQPS